MRFWYNPNFLAIIALIILSIPALKSLAIPGFYTSHDGETHTARIAQYYQALFDGQFPPRFAGNFYNGFGSPIFVYIYPLPYLLGSIIHFFGFSYVNSFKILMALSFIISAIFCNLWLREVFKNSQAAFVGAIYYVWVPYRLSLIYVRGSISEILAYTILPLLLFFITKLAKSPNIFNTALTSIVFGAFLLSQNLVVLISSPLILIYSLMFYFETKNINILKKLITVFIFGFFMASFALVPTFLERNFIKIDEIIKSSYGSHFVALKQIIYSPWGYGFDLPGTINDQISFQLGLAHILVIIFFVFLALLGFLKYFVKSNKNYPAVKINFLNILSILFLIFLFFSIIMQLDIQPTKGIWQRIKFLQIIDLPWRFTGLAVLSISFLAAFLVSKLRHGILTIILIIAILVANRNHLRINKSLIFSDDFFLNYTGSATQFGEFTPKFRNDVSIPYLSNSQYPVNTAAGWASFENIKATSKMIKFKTEILSESASIRVNKFYFPGTKILVDSKQLSLGENFYYSAPKGIRLDRGKNSNGIIFVNLDKGTHKVKIIFGETLLRNIANFFTFSALLFLIIILTRNVKL